MKNRYYSTKNFRVNLQDQEIRVVSKPGIPDWDRLSKIKRLLADNIQVNSDSRILLLGCGHGALGVFLARKTLSGNVILMDTSIVALNMAKTTLELNGINNAYTYTGVSIPPDSHGTFDVVVAVLPKGRNLDRRLLVEAYMGLKLGGKLYLAREKRQGVKSLISDAEALFGNVVTIDIRNKERVALFTKQSREMGDISWIKIPGIIPGSWNEFQATIQGYTFTLKTLPGIFSYNRIDDGTRLLLDHLEVSKDSVVLDIGCGYGIIGLVASRLGAQHTDLVDTDLFALESTLENVRVNNIKNVRVIPSDLVESVVNESYNLVVSNPPFHTGVSTNYDMARALIENTKYILAPGGKILLVANKFLRYDQNMKEIFGNAEVLYQSNRYHLIMSEFLQ